MLNRKEICQYFLAKAQQKFGKVMTELDVYYAGAEVGISLAYLDLIKDRDTYKYILSNPCTLFKHQNGNELTFIELLNLLPENSIKVETKIEKEEKVEEIKVEETKVEEIGIGEEQIKKNIGDRNYYRLLDAIDVIQGSEMGVELFRLKTKVVKDEESIPSDIEGTFDGS